MRSSQGWTYRLIAPVLLLLAVCQCQLAYGAQAGNLFSLGQRYFDTVGNGEAIPGEVVTALVQDKTGFLWIGTQFGLLRYDGYSFKKYVHNPDDATSLIGNFINTLWLANDGRLWVGTTSNGLSVFDPATETFTNYTNTPGEHNSLSHNDVWAITGDAAGRVWIGTGNGLDYFDVASLQIKPYQMTPAADSQQHDNRILSLLLDQHNNLWLGKQNGLYVKQAASDAIIAFQPLAHTSPAFAGQEIRRLFQAKDGAIWVGTKVHGLSVYRPDSGQLQHIDTTINHAGVPANPEIRAITQVNQELWVGLYGGGILIIDPLTGDVKEHILHDASVPGSINSNAIADFWLDNAGIVFIGTWGGGLNRYNPANAAFRTLRYSPQWPGLLSFSNVRSVLELADGTIWLGSWGKGIDVISAQTGERYTIKPDSNSPYGLGNSLVRTMVQTGSGSIWVGMDTGLYRYRPKTKDFQRYTMQQGLPGNFIRTLLPDSDETLWIGTRSGLARWHALSDSFDSFMLSNNQPMTEFVNALAKTPDGYLWVGTTNGLYVLPPGASQLTGIFHQPADPQSLADNLVSGLLADTDGQLWVDTRGGLNRFTGWQGKQAQFESISDQAGKPGLYMGANLLSDNNGHIWTQWHVLEQQPLQFRALNKADGIDIGTAWVGSYSKMRDGTLLYGGTKGLLMVRPERYTLWDYQPPVVISQLTLDGNSQPFIADQAIALSPDVRSFSVEFSALDYSAPEQNQYAYQLEGYDTDWNYTSAQHRVATYTNLDPGKYTLRVKASNRAGQWSPHQLALTIQQKPAWYETLWFRALFWLSGATAVYILFQHRVRYLKAKGARLQALVNEQTKALSQRNLELDKANKELAQASLTDPLTGLKNRRFLTQVLEADIHAIHRYFESAAGSAVETEKAKLHFFLIDIDHFKSVNDNYGHAAGDCLLKQMPLKLEKVFRHSDYFIRWGGEEFLVVARQADWHNALALAERLRQEVATSQFELGNGGQLNCTISIGCASYPFIDNQHDLITWQDVINIADKALYCAKNNGRNSWVSLQANNGAALLSKAALLTQTNSLIRQGLLTVQSSVVTPLKWD